MPRDAFITITKVANPNDGTVFNFAFSDGNAVTTDPTPSITGSGTTGQLAVLSGKTYSVAEAAVPGWNLQSATCLNA